MTHFFGIKPWEIDLMTFGEVDEYIQQYADHIEATESGLHASLVQQQREVQRARLGLT